MPTKVKPIDPNKPEERIKIETYQAYRARAYHAGTRHSEFSPYYVFEAEAYAQGMLDDSRTRLELSKGMR